MLAIIFAILVVIALALLIISYFNDHAIASLILAIIGLAILLTAITVIPSFAVSYNNDPNCYTSKVGETSSKTYQVVSYTQTDNNGEQIYEVVAQDEENKDNVNLTFSEDNKDGKIIQVTFLGEKPYTSITISKETLQNQWTFGSKEKITYAFS